MSREPRIFNCHRITENSSELCPKIVADVRQMWTGGAAEGGGAQARVLWEGRPGAAPLT